MRVHKNLNIKLVEAKDIRLLRHKMLRQGKKFSTTSYNRDNEENTFHLAAFLGDEIVSCGTFYPEKTDRIYSKNSYRLRGMATDTKYSRNGYGMEIMSKAFMILKNSDCDLLWCNARLVALSFYHAVGMKEIGNLFDISDIGPHYFMYKKI